MKETLVRRKQGFQPGYTSISEIGGSEDVVQMNFGILKMRAGEKKDLSSEWESAVLLMSGKTTFTLGDQSHTVERHSIFDEDSDTINYTKQTKASVEALTDCEFVLCQVVNDGEFDPKFFAPEDMFESEHRGKGLHQPA